MLIKQMHIAVILVCIFLFSAVSNGQNKEAVKEKTKTEMQQLEQKNPAMNVDKATEKPWNEVCPVRGGDVDVKINPVEYSGKYFGFCCGGCDAKFEKEPGKYSKNLSDDGKKFIGKKS
jgi:YHS domain-containing protein